MYLGHVRPAQVDSYVAQLSEPGALTSALNWYRAMRADLGALPAVTVPTTYVWSDEDQAIGRAGAERCGEFVDADYRFVELPGISHWIPEQSPEELAEAILARVGG
jgi:pimeloyl-ACP methyl ester carboxylesterase